MKALSSQQKQAHLMTILVLLFSILAFYLLGGGEQEEQEKAEADSIYPNLEIPHPSQSTLSTTRVEALEKEQRQAQERTRLQQTQASSFDWLSATEGSSIVAVQEEEFSTPSVFSTPIPSAASTSPVLAEHPVNSRNIEPSTASYDAQEQEQYLIRKQAELYQALGLDTLLDQGKEKLAEPTKKSHFTIKKWEHTSSDGFYGLPSEETVPSSDIRAVVHGLHKDLRRGSLVKFRLLDDLQIEGTHIPANTFFYGMVSFANGRALIHCENIQYHRKVYPFPGSVYDKDGFEGLYVPNNDWDEAKRKVGSDVLSATSIQLPTTSIVGSAANAFAQAVQSVAQQSVREQKLTISSNYQVIIQLEP